MNFSCCVVNLMQFDLMDRLQEARLGTLMSHAMMPLQEAQPSKQLEQHMHGITLHACISMFHDPTPVKYIEQILPQAGA